ncbi:MAG: mRNA surveillance protein pelota, partial [Candidatus Diapherotrites archaeon]|nr:mRNA surveillance protein pelota [Candidatus Diapherotrites archaeon]
IRVFVEVAAEKILFHPESQTLRIGGPVLQASPPELVPQNSYHTLEAIPGQKIRVQKKELSSFDIDQLHKAQKASQREKILIIALDDEEAELASASDYGIQWQGPIPAQHQGKQFDSAETEKKFFEEILQRIQHIGSSKVIVAGPGFTREHFAKFIREKKLPFQARFMAAASAGKNGIHEVLKSGKLNEIESELTLTRETQLVEKLLLTLGKQPELVEYGLREVSEALTQGALEELLILDEFFLQNRAPIEPLLKTAPRVRTEIHFISHRHPAGQQLKGMGGLMGLRRYPKRE